MLHKPMRAATEFQLTNFEASDALYEICTRLFRIWFSTRVGSKL